MDKRRLNKDNPFHLPPLGAKEKQCLPVDRNTCADGKVWHLTPKSRQARGKAGSQVILKCLHKKQLGALVGMLSSVCCELPFILLLALAQLARCAGRLYRKTQDCDTAPLRSSGAAFGDRGNALGDGGVLLRKTPP